MTHNLITKCLKILFVFPLFLLAVLLLSLSSTGAQSGSESDNPAHNSAENVTPVLSYSSALAPYRGYQDEAVTSWSGANALVGRIGGWRFYAKEAAQSDQSEQKSVIPLQSPTPSHHEESSKHMGHEGKP